MNITVSSSSLKEDVLQDKQPTVSPYQRQSVPLRTFFSENLIGIRPFYPDDVPPLFDATRESIKELCGGMAWCHPNYSFQDCQAFISNSAADWKRGKKYSFVIFDIRKGTFLGSIGLSSVDRDRKCANLGYWVRTSMTRRGIASIAAKLIAKFGFEELGLNRLELLILDKNKNSQRVADQVGATFENRLKKRLMINGTSHDALLYSLVPNDVGGLYYSI